MPRGMYKSRTFRRVSVRTPGGSTTTRYDRRKPSVAHCARCGAKLHGIPRGNPADISKLAKSERRPERLFGGVLCSRCLRDTIKLETRV